MQTQTPHFQAMTPPRWWLYQLARWLYQLAPWCLSGLAQIVEVSVHTDRLLNQRVPDMVHQLGEDITSAFCQPSIGRPEEISTV